MCTFGTVIEVSLYTLVDPGISKWGWGSQLIINIYPPPPEKSRTLYGAFLRYLKQCFGEVGTAEKLLIIRTLTDAY